MIAILGLSAFYHDSAAAIMIDGEIVAGAQEERFTRLKHDPGFPENAVQYCLREASNITPDRLDYVAFYDKPLLKFDRLLETHLAFAPTGWRQFHLAIPQWLNTKLRLNRVLRSALPGYSRRFVYTTHHESHAASAFFPSPFQEAAILTLDGVGEWDTASLGVGRDNRIELFSTLKFPHSLGLLYSAFTYYCGFRVNSGEYKLMGLAPYGEPIYADVIRNRLLDLKDDGSFRLDMSFFDFGAGVTMTSRRFHDLFGGPPRKPESPLTRKDMDLAASIQVVTEEIVLRMARHLHEKTGMKNLCLAGGVALNCVANGRLLREGPFENIWVQPAAGDAGGAIGAAQFVWYQLLGNKRTADPQDSQKGSLLGPKYSADQTRTFLSSVNATFTEYPDDRSLTDTVADMMAEGKVIGWMQGRMEFGPRALGSRSILGDARNPKMQSLMNLKIKFRESFRPFAPAVLEDKVHEWFDVPVGFISPYMLMVAQVAAHRMIKPHDEDRALTGKDKLRVVRSQIPAVTHVDGSARIQTVSTEHNGIFHSLLSAFEAKTGCPVIINTSFNVRNEPIVMSPKDAWLCFINTNIDVLVIDKFLIRKEDLALSDVLPDDGYLDKFALD